MANSILQLLFTLTLNSFDFHKLPNIQIVYVCLCVLLLVCSFTRLNHTQTGSYLVLSDLENEHIYTFLTKTETEKEHKLNLDFTAASNVTLRNLMPFYSDDQKSLIICRKPWCLVYVVKTYQEELSDRKRTSKTSWLAACMQSDDLNHCLIKLHFGIISIC